MKTHLESASHAAIERRDASSGASTIQLCDLRRRHSFKRTQRGGVAQRVQNGTGAAAAGARVLLAAAVTGPFSAVKTTPHCAATANSKMVGGRGLWGRYPTTSRREFCCVTMRVVSHRSERKGHRQPRTKEKRFGGPSRRATPLAQCSRSAASLPCLPLS